MRNSIVAGVAATSAATFVLVAPGLAAAADTADTTATFTIASGSLTITAPSEVRLDVNPSGAAQGPIAGIKVTDDRRGTDGWIAYVAARGTFTSENTGGTGISTTSLNTTYVPGTATTSGTVTVTKSVPVSIPVIDPKGPAVQTATGVIGANTATWDAIIAIPIPDRALAGTYTGVYTHSVA